MRPFFWTSLNLKKTGAKIKWDFVCTPKKEGGLGIRDLEVWNRAVMSKLLWYIAKKVRCLVDLVDSYLCY